MANTRTPSISTQQSARLTITSKQMLTSFIEQGKGMRYINCMPRTIKQANGEELRVVENRPIIEQNAVYSALPIKQLRGVFSTNVFPSYHIFRVYDNELYRDTTVVQTLDYTTNYVGFCEGVIAGTAYIVALENHATAARIYVYNMATQTVTKVSLTVGAVGDPVFLNGYIFFAGYNSQRIYNSAVGDLTSYTTANDFIDSEIEGDRIVTLGKHRNHLVAFGESGIEFFYDGAIEIGSPLVRQEQYATAIGTLPILDLTNQEYVKSNIVTIGNQIYFIGSHAKNIGIFRLQNFRVEKVSDPVVSRFLNSDDIFNPRRSLRIMQVNCYGRPQILLGLNREGGDVDDTFLCYDTEEDTWAWWDLPIGFVPYFSHAEVGSIGVYSNYYLWGTYAGLVVEFVIRSDNFTVSSTVTTGSVIFDVFDGGNANLKHFRHVDFNGELGYRNVATLSYIKGRAVQLPVYNQTLQQGLLRFRNQGQARQIHYMLTISGQDPWILRGLDVYYNQGSS